jgi:hypothetical protein
MPYTLRAWAAVAIPCLLLVAPAAAQQPDPANPSNQQGTQPGTPPPPPPPAPPADGAPAKAKGKVVVAPRAPRQGWRPPPPPPPRNRRGKLIAVEVPAGAPVASSPTFQRLDDGSSRIWVEVSSKVDVTENKAQGRLVYRLRGAFAPGATSQLPLVTGWFSTPVDRAHVVQQGPDVDLVIELRRPSESTQRVIETPRGMVLQVDFPRVPGDDTPGAAPERERSRRGMDSKTLGSDGTTNNDE